MRAVMVRFSSLEADYTFWPLPCPSSAIHAGGVFSANRGKGDMKVAVFDALAPWTTKFPALRSQSLSWYTFV
jgi:hypothetical protein